MCKPLIFLLLDRCWNGFLEAVVHEAAGMAGALQVGIAEGVVSGLGVERGQQAWVGAEFFWSARELAAVAEADSEPLMKVDDFSPEEDVAIEEGVEISDVAAIDGKGDDGESTLVVGQAGRADVEEARAVLGFDNIVDVGVDADCFAGSLRDVLGGDATRARFAYGWERVRGLCCRVVSLWGLLAYCGARGGMCTDQNQACNK